MSWMVSPASTWPPCELMMTLMSLSLSAESRMSFSQTSRADFWLISPKSRMVRVSRNFSSSFDFGSFSFFSFSSFSGESSLISETKTDSRHKNP